MNVRVGRAMLRINADTTGFESAAAGPVAAMLEIPVYMGALSGLYSGVALALSVAAALAF